MDINLMVLNVGNSRLSLGVFIAGELVYSTRIGHDARSEWPARIGEAWQRLAETSEPGVAGASVNPALVESLEHAALQATGQQIEWVGGAIDLPIRVLTETPEETGVDRVLNIAAAYEQLGKACVVVDAGTAITVDCCNDRGDFLGGAIAPGVSMQLNALHEHTAKLPRVDLATPQGDRKSVV